MVYGAECWAVRKKEERKLRTNEMRMLRWARGKTKLVRVRNVDLRKRDKDDATRKIGADDGRWKATSKQTKAGQKPDDD